jgi:hypothetical protein
VKASGQVSAPAGGLSRVGRPWRRSERKIRRYGPVQPSVPPHAPRRSKAPFFIALGISSAVGLLVVTLVVAVIAVTRSTPHQSAAAGTVAAPDSATPLVIEGPYKIGYGWARQLWLLKGRPYVWPTQASFACNAYANGTVPTGFYGDLPPVNVPAGGRVKWIAGCVDGLSGK